MELNIPASQTPEPCDVPGLLCAPLLRPELCFGSRYPAILSQVQAPLPLIPSPAASTLIPGCEASC